MNIFFNSLVYDIKFTSDPLWLECFCKIFVHSCQHVSKRHFVGNREDKSSERRLFSMTERMRRMLLMQIAKHRCNVSNKRYMIEIVPTAFYLFVVFFCLLLCA